MGFRVQKDGGSGKPAQSSDSFMHSLLLDKMQ